VKGSTEMALVENPLREGGQGNKIIGGEDLALEH
jgi:hypothetical protein